VKETVAPGTVILWDTFGELSAAYGAARAAFVGGSLKPCGGQNFLEALAQGVFPSIGPYWDNFRWVGEEVVTQGLVRRVRDRRELTAVLLEDLQHPKPRSLVRQRLDAYVAGRRGGTFAACRAVEGILRERRGGRGAFQILMRNCSSWFLWRSLARRVSESPPNGVRVS